VKEEELKKAPERLAACQAALRKFVAEHPESAPATTSTTPLKAITIKNYPPSSDPLSKLRKEKLWKMTKELFPPGKPLPDPYLTA